MNQPSKLTELDEKLREMAVLNWPQFVAIIGEQAIINAKVCLLRQNGRSYGEIGVKLSLTEMQVRHSCKKCD